MIGWVEMPRSTNTLVARSLRERGRRPESTPSGMATMVHSTAAPRTSEAVTGQACERDEPHPLAPAVRDPQRVVDEQALDEQGVLLPHRPVEAEQVADPLGRVRVEAGRGLVRGVRRDHEEEDEHDERHREDEHDRPHDASHQVARHRPFLLRTLPDRLRRQAIVKVAMGASEGQTWHPP